MSGFVFYFRLSEILTRLDQYYSLVGVQDVAERLWMEEQLRLGRGRMAAVTEQLRKKKTGPSTIRAVYSAIRDHAKIHL